MRYSEYQASDAYVSRQSGSGVRIAIYKIGENGASMLWLGKLTGINANEPTEQLPVEEAGNEGVDEIVTGRIGPVTANCEGIWSAEVNDKLPWRGNFLGAGTGEEYLIMEQCGDGRTGVDLPLTVFEGAKISGRSSAHGARNLKTFSLQFIAKSWIPGLEWADQNGDPDI